jgi:hypothetical protein
MRPDPAGGRGPVLLPLVTRGGILTFVALVAALHVLKPELNPVRNYLSLYAVGRWGWVMTLALLALATAATALVTALVLAGAAGRGGVAPRSRVGVAALVVYAAGVLTIAIAPTDGLDVVVPTTADAVHAVGANALFVALTVGITAFTPRFRATPGWEDLRVPGLVMGAIAWATLLSLPFAGGPGLHGLVQRTFTAFTLAWLFMVAGRVRALARAGAPVPR